MSLTYDKVALRNKAYEYCENNEIFLERQLGFGTQGMVFLTSRNTAVKVYNLGEGYFRERNIYRRLKDRGIESIQGFTIPRIESWDDRLLLFEMSVVHVPCILDFGGAHLDNAPEHMKRDPTWLAEKSEEFGDNWEAAQSIIREIEHRANIWLSDVNTGNIKFYQNVRPLHDFADYTFSPYSELTSKKTGKTEKQSKAASSKTSQECKTKQTAPPK